MWAKKYPMLTNFYINLTPEVCDYKKTQYYNFLIIGGWGILYKHMLPFNCKESHSFRMIAVNVFIS